jgi:hypothetical protein
MVSSGAYVIIWRYHVMLSSRMITHPFFYFFLKTSLTRISVGAMLLRVVWRGVAQWLAHQPAAGLVLVRSHLAHVALEGDYYYPDVQRCRSKFSLL